MRWKQLLLVGLTVTAFALTFYAISAAYGGVDTIQTEESFRARAMDRTETNLPNRREPRQYPEPGLAIRLTRSSPR